ncbi:MAG: hypothetical protein JWO30_3775 [Fibrobacteres bacterium]|nr:hypothetical protein [Fibrobacterota bacterium]
MGLRHNRMGGLTEIRTESGITLVELLAALLISAFIMVMASRIFLSGNLQFLQRTSESERLGELHRLKGMLQGALKTEVERCASGKLWLRQDDKEKELAVMVKEHFPNLTGSEFNCLEPSADAASLVEWKDRFQPALVEYRVILKQKNGKTDTLAGSWIK